MAKERETPRQLWDRLRHSLAEELQRKMAADFQQIADALLENEEVQRVRDAALPPQEPEPRHTAKDSPPRPGRTSA